MKVAVEFELNLGETFYMTFDGNLKKLSEPTNLFYVRVGKVLLKKNNIKLKECVHII